MSLVGNLEDLPLSDILQIVSLSKRTGILTIETDEGKNIIVFKNGLIVSAACPSPSIKNLGQILMERNLLTQSHLQKLLEQQKSRGNEPLGSIILEAGILDKETLEQIIKTQIKATIYHLMHTPEGNFSFDLSEVIPFDDIRYNPLETVLERGLNPQQLLLDSARISDEKQRDEDRGKKEPEPEPVVAPQGLTIPEPAHEDQFLSFEGIQDDVAPETPAEREEAVSLEDLQLPETADLPDIPFDRIAEQIDFGMGPAPAPSPPPPELVIPIAPATAALTAQRTILLVDDEALVRQIMAKRFAETGYSVIQSDHPSDALRKAEALVGKRENLWIISDLVMPTTVGNGFLGGLEIVEGVRKISSSVPIIIITDMEDPKAQTRAFALGVHHFHRKPFLAKSTVKDAEAQLYRFTDSLIDAFKQPPHQFQPPEIGDDFWSDLGIEAVPQSSMQMSATNMVRQMAALREIIQQLRNPNEAPEISLLILRYASEFFDRGLLFLVKKEEVNGLGGFGDTGEKESMPQKVRRIKIALSEESIFSKVIKKKQTHVGKLADTPANRQFMSLTGRLLPREVAMLPLISGDVIALLYGDNAVSKRPIKDLEGLEIFMVQAGIAMENALLHRKIKTLKFR
jgi:CheY-like chemotaxis protein